MDSFSLSEKTLKNLKKLEGKDTKFFSGLYKHFISSLQDEPVIDIDESLQDAYEAFGILLIESGRFNASEEQIKSILSEASLSPNLIDILTQYCMQKIVHNILARVSPSSTARIVGLTWRLDYAVQSNTVGKMSSSRFIVSIKIQGGNDNINSNNNNTNNISNDSDIREIKFVASLEEMMDLQAKFRDAVKQVDRILTSTN